LKNPACPKANPQKFVPRLGKAAEHGLNNRSCALRRRTKIMALEQALNRALADISPDWLVRTAPADIIGAVPSLATHVAA
jgi:hypothetical protein